MCHPYEWIGSAHGKWAADRWFPDNGKDWKFDRSLVEIWYSGEHKKAVSPLSSGEFCGKTEKVPATVKATHSRLLKVYEAENAKRQKKAGALSFRNMKGGGGNV
jgi:hypothetical protein